MTDYQIGSSTRRCSRSGRELKIGERYCSVLLQDGGSLVRQDFGLDAWVGPPDGAIGFWQSRVPATTAPRRPPVDDEMLIECLGRLEGTTESGAKRFRYVLALFLMRRKRLRLEDTRQEGGEEVWSMRCTRSNARFQVVDPNLGDDELESVQEEVFRVLGW